MGAMPNVDPADVDLGQHPTDDGAAGWDDQNGVATCPLCGVLFTGNGGYTDAVVTAAGDRYDVYYDAPPEETPFYCAPCWQSIETARARRDHHQLGDFGNGADG